MGKEATPQQKEEEKLFHIDHIYKVLKLEGQDYPFLEDGHIKSKRDVLLGYIEQFEKEMQTAIAAQSDVQATKAKDALSEKILKHCVPTLDFAKLADDSKVGIGVLWQVSQAFKALFLVIGGIPGLKALEEQQSLIRSLQAS